jgi:eukaryotic-like serine/threonine-protein kinase
VDRDELDRSRLLKVQDLFHKAVDLPPSDRIAFVEASCGEDRALLVAVTGMLRADAHGDLLLDAGAHGIAKRLFDDVPLPAYLVSSFGPYRLKRLLGEGGMGVVYLAERDDLGSVAAIKILRDAWLSPVRRERFAIEQRTLAQLNHASIARLFDADTLEDGTPWFAMEYVEGVPITDYCTQHESALEERLDLLRSVCEAVKYAHEHAVIHRDLKPSNILVKPDGSIRLLDFGIAKQISEIDVLGHQTRTHLRMLTPAYAAPEQIRGNPVGAYTDVYSLGVILFELLTGRLPFDVTNLSVAEAERLVLEQEPEKPSIAARRGQTRAKWPWTKAESWADLDILCKAAIHREPERRYRSVETLLRDLDHYRSNEPLEARTDSLPYRCRKFLDRHRRAVSAGVLVFALIVGLIAFFTLRLAAARDAAQNEAAKAQNIEAFTVNLFQGGDTEAGPTEGLRVMTLLDRGVQEVQSLNREPEVQADLYNTLGNLYRKLGNFKKADSLLEAGLEQHKSARPADPREIVQSTIALGLLRLDEARLDESEQLVRQALHDAEQIRPGNDRLVAEASFALGKVLDKRGSYASAIQILERAEALQLTSGLPTTALAVTLKELADTHFYAGHYDLCESLTRRALVIDRQLHGERHPLVADDLVNLGAVQYERGNYADAEDFYRQALNIVRAWYGPDHPEVAADLSMLGRALIAEQRFDEGVENLRQALAVRERLYGHVHPAVANVLNELASVSLQRGKFADAQAQFSRVEAIYKQTYGDHHYLVALAMANLASVYLKEKQYAQAEPLFREAIRRYKESLSADHLYTGIGQIKLGHLLVLEMRYKEALEYSLAGYRILKEQTSSNVSWVGTACQDLITSYHALNQGGEAEKFRVELAEIQRTSTSNRK